MIKGIVFFEEYFEFMDDMTPEQYYEFMSLIRNLRFNGIDTKPEEVTDKVVRLAWRSVRPSIKKSKRNADDHNKKKQREQQEEPQVSTLPVEEQTTTDYDPMEDAFGEDQQVYNEIDNIDKWLDLFRAKEKGVGRYEMEMSMQDKCTINNYDFNEMRAAYYAKYPPRQESEVIYG